MLTEPFLTTRSENDRDIPLLYWRAEHPVQVISSGPLGGGIGLRNWLVNATVPMSYHRDDPDAHLVELADRLGLTGPGVGLLTGVDVAEVVRRVDTDVRVWATVGLGTPIRAAEPPLDVEVPGPPPGGEPAAGPARAAGAPNGVTPERVGTVNIVAFVPARLGDAALVNAVATVTEAKAQALADLGLDATGTPTDSVTVCCPADGPVAAYGGPRSRWGAPLARAVHAAVLAGGAGPVVPWSEQPDR
ncbi:adenosylcobinamide amidohydrolase [Micromonospora echinofusca]|uniref:Adenosylcobinamide amidohydrolase n=1 Tax=Micromonospora echinofusca TaxID=47858 RepID=A0ABS3VYS6_MICEH|nr:adenosylcobinamide amidohydrolase [Micromonospora echinofusca]MBO4209695.1 adenosylcobinamide amidohydrolase [Micromonospora echinofusca]